jgi:4-aminobutyrate aminotransferase-like enzyme
MKYFNTFGGNPVSCAIAGAVLDEVEDRRLQDHALHTGTRFRSRLRDLADSDDRIGDVRGEGLYLGVEFVRDRITKEPASALTSEVCERMRGRGVVVYPNGVHGNCLKIKPPMIFTDGDADRFVATLADVLGEQR